MIQIRKNGGVLEDWIDGKITSAVSKAMKETKLGVTVPEEVESTVKKELESREDTIIDFEVLQDLVELVLMTVHNTAAKRYIIYREEQGRLPKKTKDNLWTTFKHTDSGMDNLSQFVYYRTYSNWLSDVGRRENWWETVSRAVKYNCDLDPSMSNEEKLALLDDVHHHRIFLSGRTLWMGGGEIGKLYPMANFNCAFQIIQRLKDFSDLFYTLLIGSGVGVRMLGTDVSNIEKIRTDLRIVHEAYNSVPKGKREEFTSLTFIDNRTAKIVVGDSKEAWTKALEIFFEIQSTVDYRMIDEIVLNYDNIRPKGEELKRFGGTASGPVPFRRMLEKIKKVIDKRKLGSNKYISLKSVDCLDISNIIGENVVSGGVRRTAEIAILDPEDKESIQAKNKLYYQEDGKWKLNKELSHRQVSNNSIFYTSKPSREQLHWQISQMKVSGEPAFINAEAAKKRKKDFQGVNPCGEILLSNKGLCNLETVVVSAFVKDNELQLEEVKKAIGRAAKSAYRLTLLDIERHEWNLTHKREKIVGISLTGWQDMVNSVDMDREMQRTVLASLKKAATDAVNTYADKLGESRPELVTTVKPEGTQAQIAGTSSGLHYSHSPYYIRRVRISSDDALTKVCEEQGYPMFPEVGQTEENCVTKVVEFPVKAPKGKTKFDVSAIEQLENYKMFMEEYVDHNASITVHVREHEWEGVEEWVWENWDNIVAVSFLALDDNFYDLLPYEEITKEEYERRVEEMEDFRPSLISKYDKTGRSEIDNISDCENGICPIR